MQTDAANWLESVTVAFMETPARRRMVRPLRQRVDFKFVNVTAAEDIVIDPTRYDHAGRTANADTRPGRLLNVRV